MKALLIGLALAAPLALAGKPAIDAHTYHSVGKQGAPVSLVTQQRYQVTVGDRVPLTLRFNLERAVDDVRVEINADNGLLLDEKVMTFELGARRVGEIALPEIAVRVVDEGRVSVNATVYVGSGSAQISRSFSIPFETAQGKAVMQQRVTLKSSDNGPVLRVMSATETN